MGRVVFDLSKKHTAAALFGFFLVLVEGLLPQAVLADNPSVFVRIIGGKESNEGKYPWMASLFSSGFSPDSLIGGHFCGAVLVARQYAATAAHCVVERKKNPSSISLAAGQGRLRDQASAAKRQVVEIKIHPAYNSTDVSNDVALLKLEAPIELEAIPIIGRAEEGLWRPGETATILGWGTTDPNSAVANDQLQEAAVPIRSDQECSSIMGAPFNETMICAGIFASVPGGSDGVDGCYGDSGGPLFVYGRDGRGRLVGLSSWGYACASHIYYGVYTRAANYRKWIHSLLPAPQSRWLSGRCRGRRCSLRIKVRERSGGGPVASVTGRAVFAGVRAYSTKASSRASPVRLKRTYQARLGRGNTWRLRALSPGYGFMAMRIRAYDQMGVAQRHSTRALLRPTSGVTTIASH